MNDALIVATVVLAIVGLVLDSVRCTSAAVITLVLALV